MASQIRCLYRMAPAAAVALSLGFAASPARAGDDGQENFFSAVWGMLGFFNGIGRPRITLWITITTTLANVALNYLFIFHLQWGVAGSGWARTALVCSTRNAFRRSRISG